MYQEVNKGVNETFNVFILGCLKAQVFAILHNLLFFVSKIHKLLKMENLLKMFITCMYHNTQTRTHIHKCIYDVNNLMYVPMFIRQEQNT